MRFTVLSTLTLAAAVALAACDDAPLTAPSGGTAEVPELARGGPALDRIVFTHNGTGDFQVYTMKSSGKTLVQLTFEGSNGSARWTPDHSKIVYNGYVNGYREIFSMNADGSDKKQLTTLNCWSYSPAPSPDGSKIVFAAQNCIQGGIYVMNIDGTNLTPVTTSPWDATPSWSSDGSTILFARVDAQLNVGGIWSMHANGSNPIVVVSCPPGTGCGSPISSPDGNRLAFYSTADGGSIVVHQAGVGTVSLVKNIGSQAEQRPAWSPDGKKLMFPMLANGSVNLYTINPADGTGLRAITSLPQYSVGPSWHR